MIFLVQSPHAWRGVWQRPHHLMTRFAAAGHGVRYVEPRYLSWLLKDPGRFRLSKPERPAPGIEVRPVTLLAGERIAFIRRINKVRLIRALGEPHHAGDTLKRVLWLYNPHEAHLAEFVPHDALVYDIMDEYRGFPWSPKEIADEEAELIEKADWVFAGTGALFDSKAALAEGKIDCELSGVETRHFEPGGQSSPIPQDLIPLRNKHRRLLGYAGMIDLRIDQDLLVQAARRHRDWGWILLGPVRTGLAALEAEENIYLLGQKTYDDLPLYYHAWDGALIPFVENQVTRNINPTKILEYAAADLPIVTRALPDIERYYAGGAFLYRTAEEFEHHIEAICGGEGRSKDRPGVKEKMNQAREWARERGWDAIAQRMLTRVETLCEG